MSWLNNLNIQECIWTYRNALGMHYITAKNWDKGQCIIFADDMPLYISTVPDYHKTNIYRMFRVRSAWYFFVQTLAPFRHPLLHKSANLIRDHSKWTHLTYLNSIATQHPHRLPHKQANGQKQINPPSLPHAQRNSRKQPAKKPDSPNHDTTANHLATANPAKRRARTRNRKESV